jgi:hypothetical protein
MVIVMTSHYFPPPSDPSHQGREDKECPEQIYAVHTVNVLMIKTRHSVPPLVGGIREGDDITLFKSNFQDRIIY